MKYGELQENLIVDMKHETLKLNFGKKIEEYFYRNLENLLIYNLKNWEFVGELQENLNVDMKNETLKLNFEKKLKNIVIETKVKFPVDQSN